MGRGNGQTDEFGVGEREPSLAEVKAALAFAVERALPLAARASSPQLTAWVVREVIGAGESELLDEALPYLQQIAAGELLTSADLNLAVDLCERLEEWQAEQENLSGFAGSSLLLRLRATHLALKAATLPSSSPFRERVSAASLRSLLYSLAFDRPAELQETVDRIDAGLLLAQLGPTGPTLLDESDPPLAADHSWNKWEREIEWTLDDASYGEIEIFLTEIAKLRQRPLEEALRLAALGALDARILVINEEWTLLIDPLLRQLVAGTKIGKETLDICLIALESADETVEAFQNDQMPERYRGEPEEAYLRRLRLSEKLRMQTGRATEAVCGASRAAIFAALGEGRNVIALAESSLRHSAEALAYAGNIDEYQQLLIRLCQS